MHSPKRCVGAYSKKERCSFVHVTPNEIYLNGAAQWASALAMVNCTGHLLSPMVGYHPRRETALHRYARFCHAPLKFPARSVKIGPFYACSCLRRVSFPSASLQQSCPPFLSVLRGLRERLRVHNRVRETR